MSSQSVKGYLSYTEEIAGTVWSAAPTSHEGKVGVTACLPVKGILFSFMASAWQWLNFRGSLWSCGPFLFLVLMFGFGWFRDLQIGDYLL